MGPFKRRERDRPAAPASAPGLHLVKGDVYPDWEAVYRDNVDRIYALMFAKVGNRPDAEDLTAEAFMAALGPLRVSASVGEVRAYLRTTARSVLAGYWRRHYGVEVTTFLETLDVPDPAGTAPDAAPVDTARRAERVLARLPERYREVLRLRFLLGYSVRDTASELGITVNNAKVLQHRALRQAAQLNEEVGP